MIKHYIILSSSYSEGKRIALDMASEILDEKKAKSILTKIKKRCGEDVSLSVHIITTDSKDFKSVQEFDSFFDGVLLVKKVDDFIKLIEKDRGLKGIDVAKYILSIRECDHLMLEKLTYFCYADYLVSTGKKLFNDRILAYKYGPVVESIYSKFKRRGGDDLHDFTCKLSHFEKETQQSIRSRILFAEDGLGKFISIARTLSRYGKLTPWQLVELTHQIDTPWQHTKQSAVIKDETILEYHNYEVI